jgi:tetratricopeptide (TPR) repeat protein
MYRRHLLTMAVLAATSSAAAQSATSHIALGDKAFNALHPNVALTEYQAAIAADPKNVTALWKASHTTVVLGEFSDSTRDSLYKMGEDYARKAVAAAPGNANAQFVLAEVLGRIALTIENPQGRLPYSQEVYHHAMTCLQLDPKSAECAHVLGDWNAEVMRVDASLRSMAIGMLGATELSNASWENAQKYLQQAIREQPKRAVHHLDLARVYADMGDSAKAKAEYQATIQAPVSDYNDKQYQAAAQEGLKSLGS